MKMNVMIKLVNLPVLNFIRRMTVWGLSKLPLKETASVDHFGIRLHVDLASTVGRSIWLRGTYEPEITQCISSLLKEGDTFFDVGANVGYFSMIARCLVGSSGQVVAFEPNPELTPLLSRSISENRFNNIEVVQKAVTSDGSDVELLAMRNSGFSHIAGIMTDKKKSRIKGVCTIIVPSVSLDKFVYSKHDKYYPKLIKIDVEGAEMYVLKGAEALLRQCGPALLVELADWALARYGYKVEDVFSYLNNLGYRSVNPANNADITPSDISEHLNMALFYKEL